MEININQKKITVGDKYEVFTDGVQTHYASRVLFRLLPEVRLYDINGGEPLAIIKKRFSFFSAKYDITRTDGNVLPFRTQSFWKAHYQCSSSADLYDIYGHAGRKYSIFKNDVQIAWWDKEPVSWFAGDNYRIIADRDCDTDMVISFCLIIDNYAHDNHDGKLFTYDFGNIGFQTKKFDKTFIPK